MDVYGMNCSIKCRRDCIDENCDMNCINGCEGLKSDKNG